MRIYDRAMKPLGRLSLLLILALFFAGAVAVRSEDAKPAGVETTVVVDQRALRAGT